jgi:hypothetical protein
MHKTLMIAAATATLMLSACSTGPGGQSGFLQGEGGTAEETGSVAKAVTNDPDTRVMQLAWNTARAEKCGFQIDARKLRGNYLAWEGELGATPEEVARYAAAYDQSSALFKERIKAEPIAEYCSKPVVNDVRGAVTQYVAGDFSVRQVYRRPVIVVKEENVAASKYLKSLTED